MNNNDLLKFGKYLLIGIEKGQSIISAVPCGISSFGVNYLSTNTSSP